MKPGTQKLGLPQRTGLAGKHQERRLESVLGVVSVAEQSPANAQDHRPMSRDQGGESQFGLPGSATCEPIEQLTVGQSRDRPPFEDRLELTLDRRSHDPDTPVFVNGGPFPHNSQADGRSLHFSVMVSS